MYRLYFSCFALAFSLLVAGCTTINLTPDGEQKPAAATSTAKPQTASSSAVKKESPFKSMKEVLKDATAKPGYFTTHLNRDHKLYLELGKDQLGKEFGMLMHYSKGAGVFNLNDGLYLGDMRLMKFERIGDLVYLIHVNPKFTAQEGSALKYSLNENTGHSIVQSFKIEGADTTSNKILIDATPFFVSDYANISNRIKPYYGMKPVQYDKSRSYLSDIKGFPENVEVDVMLTYRSTNAPSSTSAGVSDYRSVPVGVRYSMVALPEIPMAIRYADDRVGHFGDAVRDFSRLKEKSSYVRYVSRWRLEPSDLEALQRGELVEPKEPIVFYMDRSIPKEYVEYVKEGTLAWNKAFESAGFKNAIVVKDAPDDPNWSAEDARYSTIIWTAAHSMGYAIGPSQTDPRTGEILNADILISSTFVSGWNNEYERLIGEEGIMTRYVQQQEALQHMDSDVVSRMCMYETGKKHQLGLWRTALIGQGLISGTEPMPEKFLGDAIRDLIMHEVGHTLGMRHNFKGSSAIPYDKLNDTDFTAEHGLTLSVMDYAATNIAVDPEKQGDFVNMTVGSYDKWAISYAYKPFLAKPMSGAAPRLANPNEEIEFLQEIASKGIDPMHVYNTDEDTHAGPMALDPLSNTWDLGSDPMKYAEGRMALVEKIQPRIEERLLAEDEGYQRLRGAVNGLLFEQFRALIPVTKNVGGIYFHRDHKGDTNERAPFEPVSAVDQKKAVQYIIDHAFKPGSFHVEEDMLNKMTPQRYSDWASSRSLPIDFPIHEQVSAMQGNLLGQLTDNGRLSRMINNEVRMPDGQDAFTVADLMDMLSGEIFSEIKTGKNIDSYRRNLQRTYITRMIAIMLNQRPSPAVRPAPEDARSLARYHLTKVSDQMEEVIESGNVDTATKAHLMESHARIDQAMDAELSKEFK